LLNSVLGVDPAVKSGYTMTYTYSSGTYTLTAAPQTVGVTGQRYFFTDPTGVIRVNGAGAATSASTPL
jgi:hypothetical protein